HPMIKWPLSSVPPQPNLRAPMCLRFFNQVIAKLALKAGCGLLALHCHQAAHTIAAMKAAEEDLRRHVPPPYWYSNPATLDLAIAKQPQSAVVVPPPRRPATARSESRGLRKREGAAPASRVSPQ